MKKMNWSEPTVSELNINETAYSPDGGNTKDGAYISKDGQYTIPTYGPSTGNSGVPDVDVH